MPLKSSSPVGTEAVAVITGAVLSGAMINISLLTVPMLVDTTTGASHLVDQWARVYHYGHQQMPTMAIATFLLYVYATVRKASTGQQWGAFALAAAVTLSMLPFTWLVMAPTNNTLFAAQVSGRAGNATGWDDALVLVTRWKWLHCARAMLPLSGALLGLVATLKEL